MLPVKCLLGLFGTFMFYAVTVTMLCCAAEPSRFESTSQVNKPQCNSWKWMLRVEYMDGKDTIYNGRFSQSGNVMWSRGGYKSCGVDSFLTIPLHNVRTALQYREMCPERE